MKIKVFSLISSSVLSLSILISEGYTRGNLNLEEEPARVFHPHRFNMPERYGRLQKLKEEALMLAKQEALSSPRKEVNFRNTLQIYDFDAEKINIEDALTPILNDKVSVKSHRIDPNSHQKKVSLTVREQATTVKANPKKPTRHARGAVIMEENQLFSLPLSPKAHQYVENLLANKKRNPLSLQELQRWAKLGHAGAQYMLSARLYQAKKPIEALAWLEQGAQQGDERSLFLQARILDMVKANYDKIRGKYKAQQRIKVRSELNNPCLPSHTPIFPFAGEELTSKEKWKKTYMKASRLLIDDPLSAEAYTLLLNVAAEKPDFKDTFYRLYTIEKAKRNSAVALEYLKKAASGPQGLDVAQYQLGLERKAQGKLGMASFWFRKASKQQYWLADKQLMALFLGKLQKIEGVLKSLHH